MEINKYDTSTRVRVHLLVQYYSRTEIRVCTYSIPRVTLHSTCTCTFVMYKFVLSYLRIQYVRGLSEIQRCRYGRKNVVLPEKLRTFEGTKVPSKVVR